MSARKRSSSAKKPRSKKKTKALSKKKAVSRSKQAGTKKRKTKRKTKKKTQGKRPTHSQRISALEDELELLKKATRRRTAKSSRAVSTAAIVGVSLGADGAAKLKVTKTDDSPDNVRVSVRGFAGYVIKAGQKSGELKGLTSGTWVIVRLEVRGNRGQKATIQFKDGSPSSMSVPVADDATWNSGLQTVTIL